MSSWELQRVAGIRWLGGTTRRLACYSAATIVEDDIQLVCRMAIAGDRVTEGDEPKTSAPTSSHPSR